jgi:hypothetical protein
MPNLRLNISQGSLVFNFPIEAADQLKAEINQLMQNLKATANQKTKSTPHPAMEYRYTGDVFLEFFCNPNIYSSPFSAKVLLTLRDEKIRLTTETELTRLVEDLDNYLTEAK